MSEQLHRDWIQAARQGDEAAFANLVKAFQDKVYSYAYYVTGNRQDAEDVAQETFLKLWRTLGSYRGDCAPSAWIMQIAKHTCFDYLRAKSRRQTETLYDDFDGEIADRPLPDADVQSNPPDAAVQKEQRQAVAKGLAQLPQDQREVLTLCYINGLSYEQIALTLGQPPGTVKSRIRRAKNNLKNILKNGNFF